MPRTGSKKTPARTEAAATAAVADEAAPAPLIWVAELRPAAAPASDPAPEPEPEPDPAPPAAEAPSFPPPAGRARLPGSWVHYIASLRRELLKTKTIEEAPSEYELLNKIAKLACNKVFTEGTQNPNAPYKCKGVTWAIHRRTRPSYFTWDFNRIVRRQQPGLPDVFVEHRQEGSINIGLLEYRSTTVFPQTGAIHVEHCKCDIMIARDGSLSFAGYRSNAYTRATAPYQLPGCWLYPPTNPLHKQTRSYEPFGPMPQL